MARHGSTYDFDFSAPEKPPRRNGSGTDVILLLVLGLIVAIIAVPSLRNRAFKAFTSGTHKRIEVNLVVWANKDAGYYYCSGDRFYGHGPGSYMKQGDALTLGYQPNMGKYCGGTHSSDSTAVATKQGNYPQPMTVPQGSESNRTTPLPAPRR